MKPRYDETTVRLSPLAATSFPLCSCMCCLVGDLAAGGGTSTSYDDAVGAQLHVRLGDVASRTPR